MNSITPELSYFQVLKFKPTPCRTYVVSPQVMGKSFAQVESWVSPPPRGVTNSCGLKPEGKGRRKRRNPLTVRLSDTERELIRNRATEAGLSLNAYVRASILGSPYKPNPALVQALHALNLELTRQGGNLNQIAKLRNGGKVSDVEAESMLGLIARSMFHTHKVVREALTTGQEVPHDR